MRLTVLACPLAALALLAGCGSSDEDSSAPVVAPSPAAPSSAAPSAPASEAPATRAPASKPSAATAAQIESVIDDVQNYAPALEQVFFGSGYPKDLAGAVATAKQLTNLELSPGNRIASYRFDPSDSEFQLCIENSSGASATYDTAPMSTVATTKSGGCP